MNLVKAEKRLLEILLQKSFKYNEEPIFKLVSGRMSNYYINCKTTTLDPEAMLLIGHLFYNKVKALHINAIGGLTLGADPIAFATAMVSGMQDDAINAFVVRKKAKEHGLMKWLEGNIREGDRVVIVDDVVTTGQSTIDAIDHARESKLNVLKAIALVDRQEGGRENIERKKVLFESVFTRDDLMSIYKRT
ncbi:MAG: orotate phosphoribosyltransferase [Planctomycetia bacterium]|uniref:Orotate phosphoribosyltransferase n=2 Tax=Candidatus Brocadia sapporoensis TaxID=392547 RepID=A0A1V6M1W4_9BACT|nr:orotate phosphoribosyltransferase [Candidatus Brocadia sp.]OQD46357.1 orotate phosphoribosyltransferase [Candidatus Brocadia sapporoensis]QOJ07988.1 MAG: orotate phosphoribosyltransferase [Planctomycetia bacterium]TVL96790.1 MAG: orotate phosphoribosyltransferase [Candidatus Brocadia sp. BL1]MDG6005902.1 orotate phosphoribosyltransferase [Candidatus Brocadia sp.]